MGAGIAPAQQGPPVYGSAPLPSLSAPPPSFTGYSPAAPTQPAIYQAPATPLPATQLWRPVRFQADGLSPAQEYPIQLEPPDMPRVAQSLQSDVSLQERIRQEHRERKSMERITFPQSPVLSTDTYAGRSWEASKMIVEPNYVIYRRLYFQQNNFERYGWDLGPVTSLVCATTFLTDFLSMPYQVLTDPCRCMESNAGWCLPGDPVPLMLYPPEISLTGTLAEAGAVLAIVSIFP
jgi:hypothetical protein